VLGDIHANLEALEAVLESINARGAARIICTGDVVGYGANPAECLAIIRDLNGPVVQGNHDFYAATRSSPDGFNVHARNSILWTRQQLSEEEKEWLHDLPMTVGPGDVELEPRNSKLETDSLELRSLNCGLVHSSLPEPQSWRYIMKPESARNAVRVQEPDVVFFGHTHVPALFSFNPKTGAFRSEFPLKEGVYPLKKGWKHLVNPGSVGQPRDRDPRASYALYDPLAGMLEICRVEYDIAAARKKIIAAGLPLRNADRLSVGR
jgi:predicted phosphodiesterase